MSPERTNHDHPKAEVKDIVKTSLEKAYQDTLATFSKDSRSQKEPLISDAFNTLQTRLSGQEGFVFGEPEQAILKLKLARYFQRENSIDTNTLFDAIRETPYFIHSDKGGLHRLLKTHEQKTLQKIAEIRKRRAEISDGKELNPYESLFMTDSDKFYLARLLNMPHLQEESEYMSHCVGTSDSYVNKMKRGEVEIFSLRIVPKFNNTTGKQEGDKPVLTIEYDPKNKVVIQIKKANDVLITSTDIADLELFNVLELIRATTTDTGEARDFSHISPEELSNVEVKDYNLLTQNGEINYKKFDPDSGDMFIKAGNMPLEGLPKNDVAKIVQILSGIKMKPDEIAQEKHEVDKNTKMYIGPLYQNFFQTLPDTVEHIYTSFPESKIRRETIEIGGKTVKQLEAELEKAGNKISDYAKFMLNSKDFTIQKKPEPADLVRLKVRDLFPDKNPTTDELYKKAQEIGLELCPAEVGPHLRLNYKNQPLNEWFSVAMKPILDPDGDPSVFRLARNEDGVWLNFSWTNPTHQWAPEDEFVFRLSSSRK
jgi:hypothetical protein